MSEPLYWAAPAFPPARPLEALALGRRRAEGIRARAHREAEALRRRAREEGREQGYREGLRRAEEQFAAALARDRMRLEEGLRRLAEEAAARWERFLAELEPGLLDLAAEMARRILERELSVRPELLADQVRRGLERLAGEPCIRVRLHPDDAACLRSVGPAGWRLEEDPSVGRGGFVAEGPSGVVDGRLEARLGYIREQLAGEL